MAIQTKGKGIDLNNIFTRLTSDNKIIQGKIDAIIKRQSITVKGGNSNDTLDSLIELFKNLMNEDMADDKYLGGMYRLLIDLKNHTLIMKRKLNLIIFILVTGFVFIILSLLLPTDVIYDMLNMIPKGNEVIHNCK